jgi:acyl-CoA thioester hydrolase
VTAPPATAWRHRVEHVDTDASGVVHFSRYASLLETVVLEYLESAGAGLSALAEAGQDLVVIDLRVRYRSPARHRDLLTGRARVLHAGGARMRLGAVICHEGSGEPLAEGTLDFASVRRSDQRPVPWPPAVRTLLKGLVDDAGHLSSQP